MTMSPRALRRISVHPIVPGPCAAYPWPESRDRDRQARADFQEAADRNEKPLAAENAENTEAIEPTEAIESTDPLDPIERIEPLDPIDRIDPLEAMLSSEPSRPGRGREE